MKRYEQNGYLASTRVLNRATVKSE